jgi:hypothetical protein
MNVTALFILLIIMLAILGFFVLPRIRIKRAVSQVVAIFERNSALDARSAKTIDELGLRPPTFLEGMLRMRDFKPYALQILMNTEVVRQTDGGRLYLSQDKLAAINIDIRADQPTNADRSPPFHSQLGLIICCLKIHSNPERKLIFEPG